ncbi:hypothetical protein [Nocardia cyriacigeorgica]|uniref:hypothetical protein n=1 Tax=Nocardia cyriacigeorgica TaxID=135487 RepID=UPI002458CC15|nr:hypothetical protein [Nocardia cyriacigeorgica]
MTPDEYRDEVVEKLAGTLARYTITENFAIGVTIEQRDRTPTTQHTATAAVLADALAAAGLLPTGVRYGVGGDFTLGEIQAGGRVTPCCIHPTLDAARLDQAAHEGSIRRQWTHDWQEVAE